MSQDLPAYADGGSGLLRTSFAGTGEAVQVSSHEDVGHDDGPAAQHDVWLSFDFCFARDLVASILATC